MRPRQEWALTTKIAATLHAPQPQLLQRLYSSYHKSFKPDGEHKRAVMPGAYQTDLRAETVDTAKELYRDKLLAMGYDM
jgi:hypothetical protein